MPPTQALRRTVPTLLILGFVAAVAAVFAMAATASRAINKQADAAGRVTHTLNVTAQIEEVMSLLKDAETGQRGFLLTGQPEYLEPYDRANGLPLKMAALSQLTADNPTQRSRMNELSSLVRERLAELEQTIALRRGGDAAGALAVLRTGRGKSSMDRIRVHLQAMVEEEQRLLNERTAEWRRNVATTTTVSLGGAVILLVLISLAGVGAMREFAARDRQSWLRAGVADIARAMVGEQSIDVLAKRVLGSCVSYVGAQVGAFHVIDDGNGGKVRRAAGHALTSPAPPPAPANTLGVLGQAIETKTPAHLTRLPADYLTVSSSLGATSPVDVIIAPAHVDGEVMAAIELGFLRPVEPRVQELLEQLSEPVAIGVRTATIRARLVELLRKTQQQSETLQAQQEELRVSNEELEAQSRSLQDSQARLETQQAELEQINERLQEQTTLLERQRDDLFAAQAQIASKNDDLERANRHKSEFLANMSHELRTPLNSALILAKLLADNKPGTLTEEQVGFASTIYSAGNDLLGLINDILDLSKVEAGQLTVRADTVNVAKVVEGLAQTFDPIATQKGLRFTTQVAADVPTSIHTDRQRLEQILKNLLSNACKFTERGEVSLAVAAAGGAKLTFVVTDTGVGISPEHQELVFQPFKQVDAGANRRYGGTGLGLSISRDFARLLGGTIDLRSTPGQGSTFTVTLPRQLVVADEPAPPVATRKPAVHAPAPRPAPAPPSDGARRLLIVEDDVRFVEVLCRLGAEQGFECVVASTADQAVELATTQAPSAILLDIGLPDHSGLSVLDRVKRNVSTRHIPVHVISASDYSQAALQMGAVGYALKPVARDEILDALRKLSSAAAETLRRVLVVEDDHVQRDAICRLLATDGVETIGVATAADGLAQLRSTTFHCMVLDLNLPDTTGFDMLEAMAADEGCSFPPVIVYTAGAVNAVDEERLRRFSRSIIIKGARSPERLLDEVTLFLHQVETRLPADRRRMLQQARDRESLFEGRVILLVEDDVRNIFALSSVLEPRGAKLEIARNGREALERLSREPAVDLVLMDIMMPEMDGLEATRQIRGTLKLAKLPIIALTAKAMRDDHDRCLDAGMNDYVAKPIDVDKLLSLIRVWMPKA